MLKAPDLGDRCLFLRESSLAELQPVQEHCLFGTISLFFSLSLHWVKWES